MYKLYIVYSYSLAIHLSEKEGIMGVYRYERIFKSDG